MSEEYSVYMTGKIAEGFELSQVKANVRQLFKLNDQQLETLFSGKPVAVRRGIEKEQALKIGAALTRSGAKAVIKSSSDLAKTVQVDEPSSAAEPQQPSKPQQKPVQPQAAVKPPPQEAASTEQTAAEFCPDICCPRCGHEQGFVTACGLCKMDLSLHLLRLKRKEQAREFRQQAKS